MADYDFSELNNIEENKYEQVYLKMRSYQKELHARNQSRISVGIKINILLPLVFLVLSFITDSSKLIFLVLWVISLFGIAFYLLYVEYSDHLLLEKMKEFGIADEDEKPDALIGDMPEEAEAVLNQTLGIADSIDNKIEQAVSAIAAVEVSLPAPKKGKKKLGKKKKGDNK